MKISKFGLLNYFCCMDDGSGREIYSSYGKDIAIRQNGQVTLDINLWNYSVTTGRWRNRFLGEDKRTTEKKIKAGIYKLANLNP